MRRRRCRSLVDRRLPPPPLHFPVAGSLSHVEPCPPHSQVRQSLEQELQTMTQNAVTLQGTAGKFAAAGQAVEYLQDQKQGEPRLACAVLMAVW